MPEGSVGQNRRSFQLMISEKKPSALSRSFADSVKSESSIRFTPMTRDRWSSIPSASCTTVLPSRTRAWTCAAVSFGASLASVVATAGVEAQKSGRRVEVDYAMAKPAFYDLDAGADAVPTEA